MTAAAPVVGLATAQVDVSREDTSVGRHAGWSVATLLVWTRLSKIYRVLKREVSNIVHRLDCTLRLSRSQNDGIFEHDVALVSVELTASSTIEGEDEQWVKD